MNSGGFRNRKKGGEISKWKEKSIPKTIRKQIPIEKSQECFKIIATFWDFFLNYGQIVSNVTLVDESYVSISYTASAGTLLAFANDITQFFCVFLKRKQWTQAKRKKVTEKSMLNPSCWSWTISTVHLFSFSIDS